MAAKPVENRFAALLCDTIVGLVRQDGADLSARQMSVLLIVALEDGEHTVRGLAERLDVAKPAITRALDRLEQFDLVRRAPDPRDRRSVLVTRTAPGTAYVAYIRGLLQAAAKAHGIDVKAAAGRAAA
jgi:DNA-binding MarR family transcriptional regulator